MSTQSKPQKRWMESALKTAADAPALPFQRGQRAGLSERRAPLCASGGTCAKARAGTCTAWQGRAA